MCRAAGDVAERVREKRFADADGADDRDMVMALQEAEGRELVEERAIEVTFVVASQCSSWAPDEAARWAAQ